MRLKHVKGAEEVMLTSPLIEQDPANLRGSWISNFAPHKINFSQRLNVSKNPSYVSQTEASELQEMDFFEHFPGRKNLSLAVPKQPVEKNLPLAVPNQSVEPAVPSRLAVEIGMGKGQFITGMAKVRPDTLFVGIEKYSSVLIRALQKQEELMLPNLKLIRMDAEGIEEIFAPGEVDIIYLNFSDPWPKDRHAKRRLTSPQFLERYKKILKIGGHVEFKTDNMDLFDYSEESIHNSGWEILEITRDLHNTPSMNEGNIMTEYEERFSKAGNPIAKVIFKP